MAIRREIKIVVFGDTEADVEDAFEEAVDRLRNGCREGKDENETSGFFFSNVEAQESV